MYIFFCIQSIVALMCDINVDTIHSIFEEEITKPYWNMVLELV